MGKDVGRRYLLPLGQMDGMDGQANEQEGEWTDGRRNCRIDG